MQQHRYQQRAGFREEISEPKSHNEGVGQLFKVAVHQREHDRRKDDSEALPHDFRVAVDCRAEDDLLENRREYTERYKAHDKAADAVAEVEADIEKIQMKQALEKLENDVCDY